MDLEAGPVVVIDDEPEILEMVCEMLDMGGFEAIGLNSPVAAHRLSDSLHPDLFLVDIMLPGESGIDLARELRAEGFRETPMVAMSASREMLKEASASHVFDETLPKPFELSRFLDTVARYAG